ncbi:MAG: amylo-alpha-1,6-glucosidase [Spirochaetales bacterium]|uniref:Amylo-alpha-1,6-glucosidase n=1 Tax=Candidatus Thalassospirochaeta sargassi TaxID=3119039 RepID=A0AAJ1MJ73_9SPIO|nr:amylo-alpha-1,6-glucosidase [Spirochaetales bacterium]
MKNLDGFFKAPFGLTDESCTEWLETNGIGAFASSTVIERHDRRYHGLLQTPVAEHEGRFSLLSAVDGVISAGKDIIKTGTNRYENVHYPVGNEQLESVNLIPIPKWVYRQNKLKVQKEVFMRDGESAVYIVYTLLGGAENADCELKFLFNYRSAHELTHENLSVNSNTLDKKDGFIIDPYFGLPPMRFIFSGHWVRSGELFWDKNICYSKERERGFDWNEDRFVPGITKISLEKGKPFIIRAGVSNPDEVVLDVNDSYLKEKAERERDYKDPANGLDLLKRQSVHFILKNPSGKKSINAGYPWFGEWGRDTMISLPGLTFYSGNPELGDGILSDYISMIKDGLLPNTLGDTQGFTAYNSIDAGLLFCWALNKFIDYGFGKNHAEKEKLVKTYLPAVDSIINAFFEGRVPNAGMTENGLIWSGSADTQLTWMDATAWGRPVTPRYGLAVELNALWYDSLYLHRQLSQMAGNSVSNKVEELIIKIPNEYETAFLLDEGYLSDTVNENGPDRKLRPNMLFASSARPGLLAEGIRRAVTDTAEKELLTDLGMRTLSPGDIDFRSEYSGGPDERDSCYHQGTVWPWPLGIMVESSLNTAPDIEQKAIFWSDYIENLLSIHLTRDGWGTISEVFDGLNPLRGKGTFAQAWSCSEIIRAAELINRVELNGTYKER